MEQPTRRTTLKDVAAALGLSFTTVSRILRGDALFNEDTVRRVQEKARELNYRPNIIAQSLARRGNSFIGLVLRDVLHSFNPEIIAGVQEEVEKNAYSVILCNSSLDPRNERRHLEILMDKLVEGIIITPITTEAINRQAYQSVIDQQIPLVMVGNPKIGVKAPYVRVDNIGGGRLAAEHLFGLGHRSFAYITYSREELLRHKQTLQTENIERYQGFRAFIEAQPARCQLHLLEAPESVITPALCAELLKLKPRPTALFAYSDMMALQLARLLIKAGVRVPEEISIVGYDDLEIASLFVPALTTIAQPKKEMGRLAAAKMIAMVQGGPEQGIIITPELIARESTAQCRVEQLVGSTK
jgi:DNA-binding LacI/PurR family transcriptional regulator